MQKRRHTEVIRELVPLAGRIVADIGCGRGGLARWLAREASLVLGFDLQPAALRAARDASEGQVPVAAATAERLPLREACLDVGIVFNSLHHFPDPPAALAEAARVIRPGGQLYVAEPLPEGSYFAFMQPVDDETAVRRAAQTALAGIQPAQFALAKTADYAYDIVVRDLDAELAGWLAVDASRQAAIEAIGADWPRRYEALGVPHDGGRRFEQPMRAWCFHRS
ncbi:MAG: class I SAM-dependent methyltransferase [Geminicoccaceae bacterium]|nr:MAG: class I SAM-dependent methyltransferase [Geminicoccaceae bacterium]